MQAIDLRYMGNDGQLLKSRLTKLGIDYSNVVSTDWLGNSFGLIDDLLDNYYVEELSDSFLIKLCNTYINMDVFHSNSKEWLLTDL